MITVIPYGDSALLINLEQRIDKKIHQQVLSLAEILQDMVGIQAVIPAYCSLTVVYDAVKMSFHQLRTAIDSIDISMLSEPKTESRRELTIPVCYDPDFALDMEAVCIQTGKTIEDIIRMHRETAFYVYMLGFMPGFAYIGDMPEDFFCHRKPVPRTRVPEGSVGLAGLQTAIYPFESPGGWQIIGRTPLRLFDPAKDPPNLLKPGDLVRFRRIGLKEFHNILSG